MESSDSGGEKILHVPPFEHIDTSKSFKDILNEVTSSTDTAEKSVHALHRRSVGGFVAPDSTVYTVDMESAWLFANVDQIDTNKHGQYIESNIEKLYREKVKRLCFYFRET